METQLQQVVALDEAIDNKNIVTKITHVTTKVYIQLNKKSYVICTPWLCDGSGSNDSDFVASYREEMSMRGRSSDTFTH